MAGGPAVLGVVVDITEQKRAEEQIKALAYHDTLTGLPKVKAPRSITAHMKLRKSSGDPMRISDI